MLLLLLSYGCCLTLDFLWCIIADAHTMLRRFGIQAEYLPAVVVYLPRKKK